MIQAKQALLAALGDALAELAPDAAPIAAFETPKQAAHGDLKFPEWVAGRPGACAIVPVATRNVNARNMEPLHA